MNKQYIKLKVTITKDFYISPHEENTLPIWDQINRNINGWNWSDAEISAINIGKVNWLETQNKNILATPKK